MTDEDPFEWAIERLLAARSPRWEVTELSEEEQAMLRLAQLLRGSRGQELAPDFAAQSPSAALASRVE